jgi:hypothetical protein
VDNAQDLGHQAADKVQDLRQSVANKLAPTTQKAPE